MVNQASALVSSKLILRHYDMSVLNMCSEITLLKLLPHLLGTNVLRPEQCFKLMVAQLPLATKNWGGPVKFSSSQV